MAMLRAEFTVNAARVETASASAAAATALGLRITHLDRTRLVYEGQPQPGFSLGAIKVEVKLRDLPSNVTSVELAGTSSGIARLPPEEVKSHLDSFTTLVVQLASLPRADVTGELPPQRGSRGKPSRANRGKPSRPRQSSDERKGIWDQVAAVAGDTMRAGAAYVQHRVFIESLFASEQSEEALRLLKGKVDAMEDVEMQSFRSTLTSLILEARQAVQQAESDSSWGSSFEDRIAQFEAEARAGFPASQGQQQALVHLQGLHAIAYYAEQFYLDRYGQDEDAAPAASPPSGVRAQPVADAEELDKTVDEFLRSGKVSPEMMAKLMTLQDEAAVDRVLAKLRGAGADQVASEPLPIEKYYRDGPAKYELKWPLTAGQTVGLPFDQLDRKTQFYVLFTEWTRREFEGMAALSSGDDQRAQAIFEECLSRSGQLEVGELRARSYEGLVRVAQKRGDRRAEREWLSAALKAREGP